MTANPWNCLRFDGPLMRKILITGATGQVGKALAALSWPDNILLDMPARQFLDLANPDLVHSHVSSADYSAIINCGAYTAVDRAEDEPLEAYRINGLAPAALAKAAAGLAIPMLHVSTDYVFDGKKTDPYLEDDPIGPISVYGASKASGELAVRCLSANHVILRTSWVFSSVGTNFVKTMLRLSDRPQLRVVADQHGCPTAAQDIAGALRDIVLRKLDRPQDAPTGTYHFSSDEATTWYDFALAIFAMAKEAGLAVPSVEAIETKDYPTAARRPANSVMSTARLERDYGIRPGQWRRALKDTFASLHQS